MHVEPWLVRPEEVRLRLCHQLPGRLDAAQPLADGEPHGLPRVSAQLRAAEPDGVDAEAAAGEDGPWQVVALAHQHGVLHAEDRLRPVAGVVGREAGVVHDHVDRRHAVGHEVVPHGLRLVVRRRPVVPGHEQGSHPVLVEEVQRQVEPLLQER